MKSVLKEVLDKMEGKAAMKKLLIIDPLDGNHTKVLNLIMSTPPLTDPKNDFTLNII